MKLGIKLLNMQSLAVMFLGTALCASGALAQDNLGPPSGALYDLTGTPINHGTAVTESTSFSAVFANTDITFAFREDPAFISFSDVTLTDETTGSTTNLIANGNFASGSGSAATDWDYANVYGATFGGVVSDTCGGGLATCWYDGAVQAYDAIDQYVALVVGNVYLLSYEYSDNSGDTTFQDISTNGEPGTGGNGIDIVAYAQSGLPPPATTPEPDSIWLMATGALMLCGAFYYKRRNGFGTMYF